MSAAALICLSLIVNVRAFEASAAQRPLFSLTIFVPHPVLLRSGAFVNPVVVRVMSDTRAPPINGLLATSTRLSEFALDGQGRMISRVRARLDPDLARDSSFPPLVVVTWEQLTREDSSQWIIGRRYLHNPGAAVNLPPNGRVFLEADVYGGMLMEGKVRLRAFLVVDDKVVAVSDHLDLPCTESR